jgi:hypothetical protein
MLFGLLGRKPVLDEMTVQWMLDTFAWARRNFDARVFDEETILVTPSEEHFPGRSDSAQGMAEMILQQVKRHAGMQHWPTRPVDEAALTHITPPRLSVAGALRGAQAPAMDGNQALAIPFDPGQLRDPEVLIASYAHALAFYLGAQAHEPPPGGMENWPHVTELLAVFLGFGVMMANSANTTKIRSCGSCSGPAVERSNFLSQYDITYALAIFCAMKNIPANTVLPHLKSSLRPFFKLAMKETSAM